MIEHDLDAAKFSRAMIILNNAWSRLSCIGGWIARSIALIAPSLLAACAGVPRDASLPINDPNEASNRSVLVANRAVLHPIAKVVRAATPGPLHDRLYDLNSNLQEPRIFANDILQFRLPAAMRTLGRFATNSSLGVGGLFDIASRGGLPQETGDFGQTLFVWGVTDGPYVVLPYFGPSTTRDAVGLGVDLAADPVGWALSARFGLGATIGLAGLDTVARIGKLKEAEDASIDFYSFLRSSYYQTRRAQLRESIGLPSALESPATSPTR
ncbi:phospholipid-binding lipoprotein MlaA [Rhizobiales bacterium GAS191]|nr:phospholipid-binding lipoprotein MlaA [Rhizobiales bacterium GAS191]